MKRLATVASIAALAFSMTICSALVSNAASTPPTVNYTFEGNNQDSGNGSTFTAAGACPADPCNATSSFGSDGGDGYLEWTSTNGRGGGFVVDTNQSLTNTYTILMKFSFADFSGYRKIIDYLDRTSDTGFYIYDSKINFYPLGTSANSFTAGQPMTLMVTREATTGNAGVFTVYSYNGTAFNQELQVTDTDGTSIPFTSTVHAGGTKLGFFFDDLATGGEATTSGRVFSLKMWRGTALSAIVLEDVATAPATDVTDVPNDVPTETPLANTGGGISFAALLAGIGLVGAGIWLRNRRRVVADK